MYASLPTKLKTTQNTTKPTKHFHPNMAPATKNQKQNNKQTKPFIPTWPPDKTQKQSKQDAFHFQHATTD